MPSCFSSRPMLPRDCFRDFEPGDQGGLTYVTLVDVAMPDRPRATVAEAARRPQAIPEPGPGPSRRPHRDALAAPADSGAHAD